MKFPKNDKTIAFLAANGYLKTYNDGLHAYLTSLGYTGSLSEQVAKAPESVRETIEA